MGRKKVSQWQINIITKGIKLQENPTKIAGDAHVCRRTVLNVKYHSRNTKKVAKMRSTKTSWEEIGFELGVDLRGIKKTYAEEEAKKQIRRQLRERHIRKLRHFSQVVRDCLYKPSDSRNLLIIDGKSYSFDPFTWFYLCTPNFTEWNKKDWGEQLGQLRQHIEGSPFFEHYEKLKTAIEKLQLDYKRKANVLSLENKNFKVLWGKIQESRKTKLTPSRVPLDTKMDVNNYPSFSEVNDDLLLLAELKEYIPDINDRLYNINKQLKQLNDDFSPELIDSLIELYSCDDPDCKQSE